MQTQVLITKTEILTSLEYISFNIQRYKKKQKSLEEDNDTRAFTTWSVGLEYLTK